MNDLIKGIVINSIEYKENDAIITILTNEFGKVALYVKGYKKITSKNVYATQLFDYSNFLFDYKPDKSIQILKSANLIKQFSDIKTDYEKISIASVICEIANAVEEDIYKLVFETLKKLDDSDQIYLVLNVFLVTMLNILGIAPFVDGCVNCGRTNDIESISTIEGGFLCCYCNREFNEETFDVEILRNFRIINKASFDVFDKLIPLKLNDFKITNILILILINFSGINLKSYKNLINLNK
ncbi:MAG: DNA repair protein RecO [Bacillota bacterium]|jgi:DNA repair protein RecO (recombination protein O)|nr:DNA repair protein RecO [Bacillota bacterium]NLL26688.1 DNA repair protein RecO [Erysipelotrichia bacterium]